MVELAVAAAIEIVPETVEDEMNTNNLVYLLGGGVCLFLVILLSLTR